MVSTGVRMAANKEVSTRLGTKAYGREHIGQCCITLALLVQTQEAYYLCAAAAAAAACLPAFHAAARCACPCPGPRSFLVPARLAVSRRLYRCHLLHAC